MIDDILKRFAGERERDREIAEKAPRGPWTAALRSGGSYIQTPIGDLGFVPTDIDSFGPNGDLHGVEFVIASRTRWPAANSREARLEAALRRAVEQRDGWSFESDRNRLSRKSAVESENAELAAILEVNDA